MADRSTSDRRIIEGMVAQRALLEQLQLDGARVIGFKAGFGASASLEKLRLGAPLIGFLTDRTRLDTRPDLPTTVDLSGWRRPFAEAEVAVRLGRDLPTEVGPDEALSAVDAVAPAIEVADLDLEPDAGSVTSILAGDIFHRGVLFGSFLPVPDGWSATRLEASVTFVASDGTASTTRTSDIEALPGPTAAVLQECASIAALLGRGLRRGDLVILGSFVPPLPVGPGDTLRVHLDGVDDIALTLTG
jgi:2-keto-4-pentenoate hydratase